MKSTLFGLGHLRLHLRLLLTLSVLLLASGVSAAKPAKAKLRNADGDSVVETTETKATKREERAGGPKSGSDNASDVQSRQLARLRERLDVTDDEEWTVIAERIAKVEELRRSVAAGGSGPRGNAFAGDKPKRNPPAAASANSDLQALRAAVGDNYPDAEIKARLSRAHETHLQREAQLLKAQADLRAVLSIRQEAVVVMAGLLPP